MKDRLKLLRKTLKLTLVEFGKKVGVSKSAISSLENGVNSITDQMVVAICNAYNVNEEWLRTGNGDMFLENKQTHLSELAKQYALDDFEIMVVETFLELSPDKRSAIKDYVSLLARKIATNKEVESIQEKIDREVEAYRRELELEFKSAGKLSLSVEDYEVEENKKEVK